MTRPFGGIAILTEKVVGGGYYAPRAAGSQPNKKPAHDRGREPRVRARECCAGAS